MVQDASRLPAAERSLETPGTPRISNSFCERDQTVGRQGCLYYPDLNIFTMPADTAEAERRRPADLDDYDVDLDEIFGDITPPPGQEDEGRKRKTRENADVDDTEQPTKRARAPRVKLDEQK